MTDYRSLVQGDNICTWISHLPSYLERMNGSHEKVDHELGTFVLQERSNLGNLNGQLTTIGKANSEMPIQNYR
jgi:HPt (histidine-containing phosphotransfer) domain-containing protein